MKSSDTARWGVAIAVTAIAMAWAAYSIPRNWAECRAHGHSARYCVGQVSR